HLTRFMDIGAGPYPAQNRPSLVADRQRAAQRPAIFPAMMSKAIFVLVRLAGFEGAAPQGPDALLVVGVDHTRPAVALGFPFCSAREIIPAGVEIVVVAIGRRRPD